MAIDKINGNGGNGKGGNGNGSGLTEIISPKKMYLVGECPGCNSSTKLVYSPESKVYVPVLSNFIPGIEGSKLYSCKECSAVYGQPDLSKHNKGSLRVIL